MFDDPSLVSYAGLVPVMALAEKAGLSELITDRVKITAMRVRSAGVNPAGKLTAVIAGMAAGTLAGDDRHAVARGATLRRHLVTVPARLARPQRRRVLHLPECWPWAGHWTNLCSAVFTTGPPTAA